MIKELMTKPKYLREEDRLMIVRDSPWNSVNIQYAENGPAMSKTCSRIIIVNI